MFQLLPSSSISSLEPFPSRHVKIASFLLRYFVRPADSDKGIYARPESMNDDRDPQSTSQAKPARPREIRSSRI